MLVIPPAQEAEIGGSRFQASPGKKVHKIPSQAIGGTCLLSQLWWETVQAAWAKSETLSPK
jgi:hypothetical protein